MFELEPCHRAFGIGPAMYEMRVNSEIRQKGGYPEEDPSQSLYPAVAIGEAPIFASYEHVAPSVQISDEENKPLPVLADLRETEANSPVAAEMFRCIDVLAYHDDPELLGVFGMKMDGQPDHRIAERLKIHPSKVDNLLNALLQKARDKDGLNYSSLDHFIRTKSGRITEFFCNELGLSENERKTLLMQMDGRAAQDNTEVAAAIVRKAGQLWGEEFGALAEVAGYVRINLPRFAAEAGINPANFSEMQEQVLAHLYGGFRIGEIAASLGIEEREVWESIDIIRKKISGPEAKNQIGGQNLKTLQDLDLIDWSDIGNKKLENIGLNGTEKYAFHTALTGLPPEKTARTMGISPYDLEEIINGIYSKIEAASGEKPQDPYDAMLLLRRLPEFTPTIAAGYAPHPHPESLFIPVNEYPKRAAAEAAKRYGIPVPRLFDSLAEAVDSGMPYIIRSEHPLDPLFISGLIDSLVVTPQSMYRAKELLAATGCDKTPELDPQQKRKISADNVVRLMIGEGFDSPEIEAALLGLSEVNIDDFIKYSSYFSHNPGEFRNKVGFSYWQYIPGSNHTIVQDAAIPDRYHVHTRNGRGNYYTQINGDKMRVRSAGAGGSPFFSADELKKMVGLARQAAEMPEFRTPFGETLMIEAQGTPDELFFLQQHAGAGPLPENTGTQISSNYFVNSPEPKAQLSFVRGVLLRPGWRWKRFCLPRRMRRRQNWVG